MLATRHIETQALILILLTVLRAGTLIMELNGKSRLNEYNQSRPHSGKYCFGKTLMQPFLDSVSLEKEKMLNQTL